MNSIKYNSQLILDYLQIKNLSKNQFCKLCNISFTALKNFLSGRANVRLDTLCKINLLLKVTFDELLNLKAYKK